MMMIRGLRLREWFFFLLGCDSVLGYVGECIYIYIYIYSRVCYRVDIDLWVRII